MVCLKAAWDKLAGFNHKCLTIYVKYSKAVCRVPTKIRKQDSMTFPWLICFFSMTPILTWFQIWLWLSHNMHDHHKLESCHSHEKKQFHDFSMDFLGNFHIPRLFHDNNFFQDFPWPVCEKELGAPFSSGRFVSTQHVLGQLGNSRSPRFQSIQPLLMPEHFPRKALLLAVFSCRYA